MNEQRFNLLIIGAGPGGYVSAIRAAQLGLRVCVVEKAEVGGVCLNKGCIPTKAALKEAEKINFLKEEFSNYINLSADESWRRVTTASQEPVKYLRQGIENLFKVHNIELLQGEAYFENNRIVVKSNEKTCSPGAENIVVATGSSPAPLRGIEPDHERIITSDDVFFLKSPPQRIAIIGAGAVGVEFATLFSGFSQEVHLIEMLAHVLPFLDEEISVTVERELKKRRILIYTGVMVEECIKDDMIKIRLSNGKTLDVDCLLVAGGRKPNTELIVHTAVELNENGRVKVDRSMRTNIAGVYAIGDCAGPMMLAHTASEEGIVAVETIAGHRREMDYSAIPVTVFSSPEVALVGLTESKAKSQSIPVKSSSILFRTLGRPQADKSIAGIIKLIIQEDGIIIGCEIVGRNATEMIHTIALAIKQRLSYKELKDFVCAHPTYSELIREVAESMAGKAIHTKAR